MLHIFQQSESNPLSTSFLPKSITYYSFQWRTSFNEKNLLLLKEQILRLIEISLIMRDKRYCVLQKKVVKSKTLFQLKLTFWLVKTIPSNFFGFHIVKTYFSTNPSFRLVETYFLSSGNTMLLFRAFFLMLVTIIEIRGN